MSRIWNQRSASDPILDLYLHEIGRGPLLTADEEIRLAREIAAGNRDAQSRMIQANLRLVITIARQFTGRGLSMDDLVGEGNLGLIRATQEYDPSFGTRFSTYAAYWIKQAIRQALITTTATIRLPAHMVGLVARWRRTDRRLRRTLGRDPHFDEIANELDLTQQQREMVSRALNSVHLLPGSSTEGAGWTEQEAVDQQPSAEYSLEASEERRRVLERLDTLDERERLVVILRFGLQGERVHTLKEVGSRLGVTREWVRRIEARAIRRLDPAAQPARGTPRAPCRREAAVLAQSA